MASTYYINADTGNDTTGNGSIGTPWATLAKAITSSATNDTIIVQAATAAYAWVTQTVTPRTIAGEDAAQCVFDAGASYAKWTFGIGDFYITNITFQNNIATTAGEIFRAAGATCHVYFATCIFRNIRIKYNGGTGNGSMFQAAAPGNTSMYNFDRCIIYDVEGDTSASVFFRSAAGLGSTMTSSVIYMDGTGSAGFTNIVSATIMVMTNSIIRNIGDSLLGNFSKDATSTASYSCLSGVNTTGVTLVAGNITSDPLFVDAPNGDFRLRPTSPCIAAGTLL